MRRLGVFLVVIWVVVGLHQLGWAKWYTNKSLKHNLATKRTHNIAKSDVYATQGKSRMIWISGRVNKIHLPYHSKKSFRQVEKDGAKGISNDAVIVIDGRKFLASPTIVKVIKSHGDSKYKRTFSLKDIHKGDKVFMLVNGNRIYRIYVE